jgi:hypothetical protein
MPMANSNTIKLRANTPKKWNYQIKALTRDYEDSMSTHKRMQIPVYTRCIFERIVEIDTKKERYDADVIIDASWHDDDVLKVLLIPELKKDYISELYLKKKKII